VLRASFRLAPWCFTTKSLDLPVPKTRDASDRCLPPVRLACTRTSRVPGSYRCFRGAEAPRSLGSMQPDRGPGRSRRPWSLRRIVIEHVTSSPEPLARPARSHERGHLAPTVHDATEPLTLLSRLPLPPHVHAPSRVQTVRSVSFAYGSLVGRSRQGRDPRHLVKGDASRWPGVPSAVKDSS